jgi:myo-inositol-1(or 4)-monophosphatase
MSSTLSIPALTAAFSPAVQGFLRVATTAAHAAGLHALGMQKNLADIRYKGAKDLVTEADMQCDHLIREHIVAAFSDHNLVTEELGDTEKGSAYTWYVDPIDGTINYSRRFPLWGVSVGLAHEGRMLCGVIYLPASDEMFIAARGEGAYLNGERIKVSETAVLAQAIISHGDFNVGADEKTRRVLNEANFLARMGTVSAVQRVKCLGSAVVEGAYVASGRMEGYCMVILNPWDVAVTSLLVTEAGGKVTTLTGEPYALTHRNALFSNGILHQPLLNSLDWDGRHPYRPET